MNTLAHADTFFLISSVGFCIFFILGAIALWQFIMLLSSIRRITKQIETGMLTIGDEARAVLEDIRSSTIFTFLFGRSKRAPRAHH